LEQQWCGKTEISIYPQKFQNLDQYLMKSGHTDEMCQQNRTFMKAQAAKSMNIRAVEKY